MNTDNDSSNGFNSPDDLMTVPEVAIWLRVTKNLIYELVRRKQIPSLRVGKCVRLKRSDVLESLRSSKTSGISKAKSHGR